MQSEAGSGVELAASWEGFSIPLGEVCASCWHVPSLLLFCCSAEASLAFVGLGSPLKFCSAIVDAPAGEEGRPS